MRYDYRLTEKGRDLWLVLTAMRQWGDRWEAHQGAPVEIEHQAWVVTRTDARGSDLLVVR